MRKHFLALIICACMNVNASATGDSLHFLTSKDTLFVNILPSGKKTIEHRLEKGQTLFSLAGFYGLKYTTLLKFNPELNPDKAILQGKPVRIPLPDSALQTGDVSANTLKEFAPVYYIVKQGETLYRISKVFFRIPIETVRKNNGLSNDNLKTGQKLHIGWLSTKGIPESLQTETTFSNGNSFYDLKTTFEQEALSTRPVLQKGAAYWHRERKNEKEYFAMHRFAPVGSVIKLHNPMKNTVSFAKVVSTISDRIHGSEIIVVLSAPVARQLGAKDPRFFVEVSYFKY
jgi:LysM repeat protein